MPTSEGQQALRKPNGHVNVLAAAAEAEVRTKRRGVVICMMLGRGVDFVEGLKVGVEEEK
jgi:hypothetical protein